MKGNNTKTALAWVIVLAVMLAGGLIGAIARLVYLTDQVEKYETIIKVSCDYAPNKTTCLKGVEMMKDMDIKTIKMFERK